MLSVLDKVEARGIALGEARGIAATARRMIRAGLPVERIAEYTGLSHEEIEGIGAEEH